MVKKLNGLTQFLLEERNAFQREFLRLAIFHAPSITERNLLFTSDQQHSQ